MKKVLLCSALCAVLLTLLLLPSFASEVTTSAETTSAEYADWFGSQTVTSYSITIDESSGVSPADLMPWLMVVANRTIDSSASVGSFTVTDSEYATRRGAMWYTVSGGSPTVVVGGYSVDDYDVVYGSTTIDSDLGYTEISSVSGVTVTPVTSGSAGFVDSGVVGMISYIGQVLTFCLTSPVMYAIGISVGVALLGWAVVSIKDLIKGY